MPGPFDLAVIGGGIVGLAVADRLLAERPRLRVGVVEKEPEVAAHQTGHNSGVIHSGLYYKPGSLKARLCVTGADRMKAFCSERGVPWDECGKVVVAVDSSEIRALDELERRGTANGVPDLTRIGPDRLREIEPHAIGVAALHVPGTAIVDYREVARALAARFVERGGELLLATRLESIDRADDGVRLATSAGELRAGHLIGCAGLQSDRVARMEGLDPGAWIVPFRGEYYELVPERRGLVRGLVYPVPDPRFPFLGVHLTRTIHGGVEAGPNAVVALAREGYGKPRFSFRDCREVFEAPAFWKLAARYWRTGLGEIARSLSKRAFARALARLVPELSEHDIVPAGCGIRAQALGRDGGLVDDFLFVETSRSIHVLNAPSPAATASLTIAAEIVRRALARFDLP